jgi:hypothetical protein
MVILRTMLTVHRLQRSIQASAWSAVLTNRDNVCWLEEKGGERGLVVALDARPYARATSRRREHVDRDMPGGAPQACEMGERPVDMTEGDRCPEPKH